MKILINGCGVAGPTLAYWLDRYGHEAVLVERAPELRTGGYMIDCWGVGYAVIERMGLIPKLSKVAYDIEKTVLVDDRGRRTGGFSDLALDRLTLGRVLTLRRGDLAAELHNVLPDNVETLFDETVTELDESPDRVRVSFEQHAPRDFDLVVGADGLHSQVRALSFGNEEAFAHHLGYRVAVAEIDGYRPRDEGAYMTYTVPGRQVSRISVRGDRTIFLFIMRDERSSEPLPTNDDERRAALRRVFRDDLWEVPDILAALDVATNIYFDRADQIRTQRWSKGRTVLVGDAAACASLMSGEGSGLALTEAYVLATELADTTTHGQLTDALQRYEDRLRPFITDKQYSAGKLAGAFVPKTRFGIAARDLATKAMAVPFVSDVLLGRELRKTIPLPEPASDQSSSREGNR